MAYAEAGAGLEVSVTIDGETVWSRIIVGDDHLQGYQLESVDLTGLLGEWTVHEICWNGERGAGWEADSYFVDAVGITLGITPTEATSFSTVKSLY